jgi:hypothetical protein
LRLAIACIIVLLIIGCSGSQDSTITENYKTGVKEVNLRFLPNAPPAKIFGGSNFKMVIELDNQAGYEVSNGRVTLIGIDDSRIKFTPNAESGQHVPILNGRTLTSPAGDKQFIEFDGTASKLFLNRERHTENFFTKLSYESRVDFVDTVCINTDLYSVYDSGCKVQDRKSHSGQGAPLVVSSVEEIIYPGDSSEIEFRILVKNQGQGKVKSVRLLKALLGNDQLECDFKSSGLEPRITTFTDKKQEQTLICTKKSLRGGQSYTTTLALELEYDYVLTKKQKLTLVK